jgi:hypothetical protein
MLMGRAPARSAARRPMVTSGAAPLIVYAFRRVRRRTTTDAFETRDAGRARVHLPSEAGTPDMTIGRAEAERVPPAPAAERLGPIISRVAHSETNPSGQAFF